MNDLYIIGSGGFAKEVYHLVCDINAQQPRYRFAGFIDKSSDMASGTCRIGSSSFTVFGEDAILEKPESLAGAFFAIGVGTPQLISKITRRYQGFTFPNLVHPNVTLHGDSIKMGAGNIMTSGCRFTVDIEIGSFNIFNLNTTVGHDARIGDFNVFNPGVQISGGVRVDNEVLVGTGASVLQNISISARATLGAGAVLTKDLEEGLVAVGIPAKPLGRK